MSLISTSENHRDIVRHYTCVVRSIQIYSKKGNFSFENFHFGTVPFIELTLTLIVLEKRTIIMYKFLTLATVL